MPQPAPTNTRTYKDTHTGKTTDGGVKDCLVGQENPIEVTGTLYIEPPDEVVALPCRAVLLLQGVGMAWRRAEYDRGCIFSVFSCATLHLQKSSMLLILLFLHYSKSFAKSPKNWLLRKKKITFISPVYQSMAYVYWLIYCRTVYRETNFLEFYGL